VLRRTLLAHAAMITRLCMPLLSRRCPSE
jgi:hypothetical protein